MWRKFSLTYAIGAYTSFQILFVVTAIALTFIGLYIMKPEVKNGQEHKLYIVLSIYTSPKAVNGDKVART